jgi:hypothetical protein
MTRNPPDRGRNGSAEPQPTASLRLRLWLACLGGSLVAAGGIWWVIGTQTGPGPATDLALVVSWLGAVAGLSVIVGAAFALWLDRGIVAHARGLTQAVATQQIALLRGLPGTSGWGELSQLTQQIQQLVAQYRHAERAADELGLMRDQLAMLRDALERWTESERWVELRVESGPVAPVAETVNRGLRRLDEVREQNLEAARQIAAEMERGLDAARQSAEQAERGFVEATALLTTVRELQRLGHELGQVIAAQAATAATPSGSSVGDAARQAIEELVAGSSQSVEHLSRGLRKVEEIAEQVPLLANRATLIALDRTLGGRVVPEAELAEEARRLVLDIRSTVERTATLVRELETEIATAESEMRGVRERVALKLEGAASSSRPAPTGDASRLLDRVREMVQDATRKGERLSATGEGASRAAEGLLRALEAETREMAGLMARLAPVASSTPRPGPQDARSGESTAQGLRLLDAEDLRSDRPDAPGAPGSAEEPR